MIRKEIERMGKVEDVHVKFNFMDIDNKDQKDQKDQDNKRTYKKITTSLS